MARLRTLAVLTHQRQGFGPGYFLALAGKLWEERGGRLLVHQGLQRPPSADAAILHVDLTRTPEAYAELAGRYPLCLNGRVGDISKRTISEGLVSAADDYDGPVVVKPNLNHGGEREAALSELDASRLRRLAARFLPARWSGRLPAAPYQVFARKSEVPGWAWRHPGLVVERQRIWQVDGLHAVGRWFFLGDRGILAPIAAPEPIVQFGNASRAWVDDGPVPEDLLRRRRELGFDFGKFDYVLEGGRAYLIDANRTPYMNTGPLNERMLAILNTLADGLERIEVPG